MIINGDAIMELKKIESESVDCVITSPPYWQQRDYQSDGQLGLESTFEEYIDNLVAVFDEVYRVLKPSGSCWIVIGDVYAGDKFGKTDRAFSEKMIEQSKKLVKRVPSSMRKSLMLLPHRLAISMIDRGWILRNEIIWQKPKAMPASVKDRFTVEHETIFFFTKSRFYHFNQIKEPMKTNDYNPPRGSKASPGNMQSGRRTSSKNRQFYPEDGLRNKRTIWSVNQDSKKIEHYAMFPKELIRPMIQSGCPKGGTVLDPFSGSGTTGIVAKEEGCEYIGIEINPNYASLSEKRIKKTIVQTRIDDYMKEETK